MQQAHYYGDKVRSLLITIGIIMIVTLPFFTDRIPKPASFSIIAVLAIVILSGLLNPKHKSLIILNTLVSAVAFIVFEYYAVSTAQSFSAGDSFFIVNQALAILALLATYFGTKSVRGFSDLSD